MRLVVAVALAVALPAFASEEAAGLRFSVPKGWQRGQPSSPLAIVQLRIPRARGDDAGGEVVLFRFGDAKGGGLSDNVERWYSQFKQPDGRPSKEVAVVTTRTVHGLTVKTIDLSGTYRAQMGPMDNPSKPGYRLLGAVVEGHGDPWCWRAVGPAKTMEKAKEGFDKLIDSLEASP
jgi:hypothetical protein